MSVHDDVLAAAKDMLNLGLTAGTSGNVSGRLEDGSVVITPSSIPYDEMVLADLVVIDMDRMGKPDILAQPPQGFHPIDRTELEILEGVALLV